MKKPTASWQTKRHTATRREAPVDDGPRAESFVLRFHDGRSAELVCGLREQRVPAWAFEADPDLAHAIACWLIARGARAMRTVDERGQVLREGTIGPSSLDGMPRGAISRIVTICPSNAEMVHALDCFDRVVACEDSSDHPPEVARLERLGPDLGVDLDRIVALAPDLVVSSLTVPGMERNVVGLRARGVPQLVLAPRGLGDVLDEIDLLGRALDVPERAAQLRRVMDREIADLERTRRSEPVRVYLEWWPRPMFSPGRTCYSNELIRLAGGVNVFGEREGSSVPIEVEDLRRADPQICFVSWCGVSLRDLDPGKLLLREGLADVTAVRTGQVHVLDEALSGRPGPRMLEAARVMAHHIEKLER